ncbi:MAG: cereblon family protein [Acidobacteriota bacterium]
MISTPIVALLRAPRSRDDAALAPEHQRSLLCRACREPVTSHGERAAIAGSHVHDEVNPSGFRFRIGCFQHAPGAIAIGVPTLEHTWFAGYAWSYALCRGCREHLGWLFENTALPPFFGLVLDRLIEGGA